MIKDINFNIVSDNPWDIREAFFIGYYDCIKAPINSAKPGDIMQLALTKTAAKDHKCNSPSLIFEIDRIERGEFVHSGWHKKTEEKPQRQIIYSYRIYMATDINGFVKAEFCYSMSNDRFLEHKVNHNGYKKVA